METLSNMPGTGEGRCEMGVLVYNITDLAGPSEICAGYKIHLIKEALSVNKKCGRAEVDCT